MTEDLKGIKGGDCLSKRAAKEYLISPPCAIAVFLFIYLFISPFLFLFFEI